jgi:L-asparaginase
MHSFPVRPRPLQVSRLEYLVPIVTAALGDDGDFLGNAAAAGDGLVLVAFGAGHVSPGMLRELRNAAELVPVLVTCRPDRSSMLFSTYGFEGAEPDVRSSGGICVPFLSPPAARIALQCGLGAGLDRPQLGEWLAPWDAA